MIQQFSRHVRSNNLFTEQNRLLLAISGGVDSVVLCHLLTRLGYNITLAHCNYKLRGKASDGDETFCRKLAADLHLPIRVRTFDVSKEKKGSLQEKARKVRYDWFRELLHEHGLDYIVTAHHAGDQAETVLINLVRSTGLKGLRGIAEKEGVLVRPLLPFLKEELEAYAKVHRLRYRTDDSNAKTTYRRNFIRHKVMPLLKELNPSIERTLAADASRFRDEYRLLTDRLSERTKGAVTRTATFTKIDLARLDAAHPAPGILHLLLEPFGFNSTQVRKIIAHRAKKGLPGKKFIAPSHRLTIDRDSLVIEKRSAGAAAEVILDSEEALKEFNGFRLQAVDKVEVHSKNELVLSPSRLQWPLVVRGTRRGDRFRPFGMKGKKLLSDFLREQKLNAFEKERVKVLENGNGEIVWVIGHRSDERYRVGENDQPIIKITFIEQA